MRVRRLVGLVAGASLAAATLTIAGQPATAQAPPQPRTLDNDMAPIELPPGMPQVAAAPYVGAGFTTFDFGAARPQNRGSYTIRLVSNSQGNVETLRSAAQGAATLINLISGVDLTVAPGTVPDVAGDREPAVGEILISWDSTSPCNGSWAGCGGPRQLSYNGTTNITTIGGGRNWIHPVVAGYDAGDRQQVVSHELGHALGLGHWDGGNFEGSPQVMDGGTAGYAVDGFYRSGDWNGFRYLAPASWRTIGGTLTQLDFGPQGQLWGVNSAGTLYQYAGNSSWTPRGSGFKHVTVGDAPDAGGPDVYALKTNGSIHRWNGSSWSTIGGTLTQLDFGPQGDLWGVNAAGTIYQYAGNSSWTPRGSGFKHVTVGDAPNAGGPDVYAIKTNGTIQRWNGSSWSGIAGNLTQLDFGPQGDLWGVNSSGNIYEYAGAGSWAQRGSGFKHVTVGVAPDAGGPYVYAIRTDGTIQRWVRN